MTTTESAGISRALQSVGRRYVQYFNRAHGRTGGLWEGRYHATVVQTERYLAKAVNRITLPGAVFIVVILALVFAGGDSTRTAREDVSPPATTGMAPRTAPPTVAVPPGQPPSTTGQSGQQN